jgi:trehalose/maltose hydrolase-like predicted phosphorylase
MPSNTCSSHPAGHREECGPGRLSASWLQGGDEGGNPWLLETKDPHDPGHRNAFLGNGLLGQRIGVEGDAGWEPGERESAYPACLMHGLWDESRLMAPPRWAVLAYHDGRDQFSRNTGEWRDFRQVLDLKHGILETETRWINQGRESHLRSVFFLSRTRPNVGVLVRTIRPEFSGEVSFSDRIDGNHIEDASGWRFQEATQPGAAQSLLLTMGPRRRQVAVVSRLCLLGVSSPRLASRIEGHALTRTVTFAVEAGRTYTVAKYVAIVSDRDAGSPRLYASALVEGAALDPARLEREHRAAWDELWRSRIEMPHFRLQRIITSCLYQFYCHLRPGSRHSLGPAGLSAKNWGGRVFWDSDLWMFPVVALLHPELGRGMVDYRFDTLEGARRNARADGYEGAMFAWESAEFGDETIPDLIFHRQHHVNSDVALAQWWFWKISGDDEFFRDQGAAVILESARFWASRAVYNAEQDRYEIRGVCCADEFAEIQDNNAYTNYSAVKTFALAAEAARFLDLEIPDQWTKIARKMWIPFDEKAQRIVEHEGYAGAPIKQADAALLFYPYAMPTPPPVKENTVDYYRGKYPPGNIMMAAAIDGIIDCELGRAGKAWQALESLMPHFRTPFLSASESPRNEIISFATGLGGFLQLVVMGFAGVRIGDNDLVVDPCLPPPVPWLKILGLHYRGATFDLTVDGNRVRVDNASGALPFRIVNRAGQEHTGSATADRPEVFRSSEFRNSVEQPCAG